MQSSRLIPFTVAGTVCFAVAFVVGAGFWYFFGTKPGLQGRNNNTIVQTGNQNPVENNQAAGNTNSANINPPPSATPTPTPEQKKAPAGEIKITGGEVTLGGDDTKLPLRRVDVTDFAIAETEVTNAQYAEFIKAADHKAPNSWNDGNFLPGTEDEPVVGVSWADADDYCEWLSKELGATARLPSEAEWERAARGDTDNKYPWGGDWNDDAASSLETKGKLRAVKSFPAGRSPFGVYEMVGNVWEWTSDPAIDQFGKPILFGNLKQRIIKGGSYKEERKYLTIDVRAPRPEEKPSELIGFRYVVIRK